MPSGKISSHEWLLGLAQLVADGMQRDSFGADFDTTNCAGTGGESALGWPPAAAAFGGGERECVGRTLAEFEECAVLTVIAGGSYRQRHRRKEVQPTPKPTKKQ